MVDLVVLVIVRSCAVCVEMRQVIFGWEFNRGSRKHGTDVPITKKERYRHACGIKLFEGMS